MVVMVMEEDKGEERGWRRESRRSLVGWSKVDVWVRGWGWVMEESRCGEAVREVEMDVVVVGRGGDCGSGGGREREERGRRRERQSQSV